MKFYSIKYIIENSKYFFSASQGIFDSNIVNLQGGYIMEPPPMIYYMVEQDYPLSTVPRAYEILKINVFNFNRKKKNLKT